MTEQTKNSGMKAVSTAETVADMAHELRSPLGGIESMIAMLGESRSQNDQDALIAGLKSAAAHLRTVANALLKPGQSTAQPVAAVDALRLFGVSAEARARSAGIRFRKDIAPACEAAMVGDGTAVRQMLENLMDNAINHGAGGEIVLCCDTETTADGADMVRVSIVDQGRGLTSAAAQGLFARGMTGGTAGAGAGLGLSIVARLASAMGGTCGAEARQDGPGMRFWFTVPVVARRESAQNQPEMPSLQAAPILVVDDDAMSQVLLKTVLGHLGHEAVTVSSPTEAQALMQDRVVSAVFTDITMPGTNGWSFIEGLRRDGVEIPVVGVSGRVTLEDKKRTMDAGANWVVEKPATIHDLRQALIAIGLRDPMVRQVNAA